MAHTIPNRCINCGDCAPQCPTGAVKLKNGEFWIDPTLCNDCEGYAPKPQCVIACPISPSPMPLKAKKGRCKTTQSPLPSPSLFSNGKDAPFASAIAIWEACNVLSQSQSLPWKTDHEGKLYYKRQVNGGRASISFRLTKSPDFPSPITPGEVLNQESAEAEMSQWDTRAACLHLIYAAHATALEQPWEEDFLISDRQIETYLGLKKRKDLSKLTKLTLIKKLAQQPCKLQLDINWSKQGRVNGFCLEQSRLWHLLEIQHHFQADNSGCKHLTGLTFRIRAGAWAKHFLNQQGARDKEAFYQYSNLPKSLLLIVTSLWQQHEGSCRMLLWLLFKTKMGSLQRLTIPTLLRIAYGDAKVLEAASQREKRKRLLRSFESDLEILNHYGLKPIFDPLTYPPDIQPLWAKLADIPDDPEAALDFWTTDGNSNSSLTDTAPRDKWQRLMQARLLCFDLPEDWKNSPAGKREGKGKGGGESRGGKGGKGGRGGGELQVNSFPDGGSSSPTVAPPAPSSPPAPPALLSSQQILAARKSRKISQRDLANSLGKSQSWVRDVESGRLQVGLKDQQLLLEVLGLTP